MNVEKLIQELKKCDPKSKVMFFNSFDSKVEINDISPMDCDDHVLIGENLPAECYALDYKNS